MWDNSHFPSREIDGGRRLIVPPEDAEYRFSLPPLKGSCRLATWMMLNPSEATEAKPKDPTMDRVRRFTCSFKSKGVWDCDDVIVVNVLPYRNPCSKELNPWLRRTSDEIFELKMAQNRAAIVDALTRSDFLVCAWGSTKLRRKNTRIDGRIVLREIFCEHNDLRDKYINGGRVLRIGSTCTPTHPMARGVHRVPNDATPNPYKIFG